jgi:hypothetical protein
MEEPRRSRPRSERASASSASAAMDAGSDSEDVRFMSGLVADDDEVDSLTHKSKRARHRKPFGSTEYYMSCMMPDGPVTTTELADWPVQQIRSIMNSDGGEVKIARLESLYGYFIYIHIYMYTYIYICVYIFIYNILVPGWCCTRTLAASDRRRRLC